MRGKVLGGSSSINVMAYTRGNRGDYDRWAQKGARGWSYADVLPYFNRAETWEKGANTWRGGEGPLGTQFAKTPDPIFDAWLEAAEQSGYPFTDDYNGKQQEGFGRGQYTIRDGRRSSTSRAYLRPARGRHGLTVETDAHATRITMQGTRATGVEYVTGSGDRKRAEAGEVIVASGTFNSPQLLMLSGIGPSEHLRADRDRVRRRSAGRKESAGPHRRLHDLFAQESRRVPPRDAVRPHGDEHADGVFPRHRSGDRRAGRTARLRQDAAGAGGARHRVHVPRHLAPSASVVPVRLSRLHRRLRHPADADASRQPRRAAAALVRSARARRASATTSSPRRTICRRCGKASSSRASLPSTARSIPIAARSSAPAKRCRPTPRSMRGCARR